MKFIRNTTVFCFVIFMPFLYCIYTIRFVFAIGVNIINIYFIELSIGSMISMDNIKGTLESRGMSFAGNGLSLTVNTNDLKIY